MSVSGIEALGFTPLVPGLGSGVGHADPAEATRGTAGTQQVSGAAFGDMVMQGITGLEGMHDKTDGLAVQAATGDLGAIHQYTVAATEMNVATQLTVAVRNKAVEAFHEIMRMQV